MEVKLLKWYVRKIETQSDLSFYAVISNKMCAQRTLCPGTLYPRDLIDERLIIKLTRYPFWILLECLYTHTSHCAMRGGTKLKRRTYKKFNYRNFDMRISTSARLQPTLARIPWTSGGWKLTLLFGDRGDSVDLRMLRSLSKQPSVSHTFFFRYVRYQYGTFATRLARESWVNNYQQSRDKEQMHWKIGKKFISRLRNN